MTVLIFGTTRSAWGPKRTLWSCTTMALKLLVVTKWETTNILDIIVPHYKWWHLLSTIYIMIFTLVYGTVKNNFVGDCFALIRMCWKSFPSHSNKLEQFYTCQKELNSYWKERDGTICNDANTMDNSPSLRCGDPKGWTSFAAIEDLLWLLLYAVW